MAIEDARKRWLALYLLGLASLMIVFDMTIVNVALPSIKAHSVSRTPRWAWVLSGYLLAYGGFLLLGDRLGDLFRPPRAPRAVLLHNDVTTR